MGYLVLARKWRPRIFEEVAGQDHVTRTLANAIRAGRVGHAYLFTGPRGVGKTTTARILARALNCESGPTPDPCGKCETCRSITAGSNLDVLEIDGASNRGIDDVRELREQVRYAPSEGRYKVYIVDEVHMLTDQAFNALLKTLEEPPPRVVFVFATTSPQKIPVTILSRCQRFDFSRIPAETIRDRLEAIAKKEKFEIDGAALALLAKKARGSLRDAESLLDQVTAAAEGRLDEKKVVGILGIGERDLYFAVSDHVAKSDTASALSDLDAAFRSGLDLSEFMSGLVEHLRSLFLMAVDPDLEGALDVPSSEAPRYREQAAGFTQRELLRMMEIASQAAVAMRRSDDPRLHAELALARMAEMGTEEGLGDIVRRIEELEARLGSVGGLGGGGSDGAGPQGGKSRAGAPKRVKKNAAKLDAGQDAVPAAGGDTSPLLATATNTSRSPADGTAAAKVAAAGGETSPLVSDIGVLPGEELGELWAEVVRRVTDKKAYLGNFLAVASPVEAGSEGLSLAFPRRCGFHKEKVSENINRRLIQREMQEVFGRFLPLRCVTMESAAAPAGEVGAATWTGGPEIPSGMRGADAQGVRGETVARETSRGETKGVPGGASVPGGREACDDPLRRVLEVFDGEVVDGPRLKRPDRTAGAMDSARNERTGASP